MLLLCVAALVVALVPLDPEARPAPETVNGRSTTALAAEGPLRAGSSKVRIPIGQKPVLAGYPGWRRGEGKGDELFVRAIALQSGGITIYLASVEALLVPGELEEEVLRRAGLPRDTCLLLAATHTHSGPGGTWNNPIASWAGNGPFDREQRDALAQAIADALRAAVKDAAPAQLQVARASWAGGPARPRSEGPIDPTIAAIRLRRADGLPVATAVVYGMHPTTQPREERRLSGDWPGETAAILERATRSAPALVLQGAVGNTTWDRDAQRPGAAVAARVQELLRRAPAEDEPELGCAVNVSSLPRAEAPLRVPSFLRRAATNAEGRFAPRWAVQTWLKLGSLALLGVPGEPVGELAIRSQPTLLVWLADGYVGYVETPERWQSAAGESARTHYGPGLAQTLVLGR